MRLSSLRRSSEPRSFRIALHEPHTRGPRPHRRLLKRFVRPTRNNKALMTALPHPHAILFRYRQDATPRTMGSNDFFERWASLRGRLVAVEPDSARELVDDARSLDALATGSRELALAAAVQVRVGAQVRDGAMLNHGFNRLTALSGDELRESLETVSDLTCLGRPRDRWRIVRRAVGHVVDPAVAFIDDPTPVGAGELLENDWAPDETLMPELRSELRLQVGWAAVELLLTTADVRADHLARLRLLRFRDGEQPGWWERSLQQVALSLLSGDVEEGVRRLVALKQKRPPAWADERIRFEVVRLAPLAVERAEEWIRLCPGGLPSRQEAPSTMLAAATVVADVLLNPTGGKPGKLAQFQNDLDLVPWAMFGLFTAPGLRESLRDYLAERLSALPEATWPTLPWAQRFDAFLAACTRCTDVALAVELVLNSNQGREPSSTVDAIAQILQRCGGRELGQLDLARIAEACAPALDRCPPPLVGLLSRRGIVRAAIDGSNVMWGGRGRGAGGHPKLSHLTEVIQALRDAGYLELGVFVDARTRHELSPSDAQEMERMVARNEISVVRRSADPAIIRYFLESPSQTEIVTGDEFRDWRSMSEFSELNLWWPACRRLFYIDPNERVRFNIPLDRPVA